MIFPPIPNGEVPSIFESLARLIDLAVMFKFPASPLPRLSTAISAPLTIFIFSVLIISIVPPLPVPSSETLAVMELPLSIDILLLALIVIFPEFILLLVDAVN
ncbi:hypothetical protein I4641_22900 [Waterburya agarophytonicola K14]|uniref:Uncharacterized protein n=1 Tax=Waterburya agarophytonicola KI4 TaxID=2874699 RepID=A0A964BU06_9CYAN|nr:hypothetical protein [Waterburya agarophytonicola]MCC0179794.1 hypothetical protein [Waterburya agarophytonicola KI4]